MNSQSKMFVFAHAEIRYLGLDYDIFSLPLIRLASKYGGIGCLLLDNNLTSLQFYSRRCRTSPKPSLLPIDNDVLLVFPSFDSVHVHLIGVLNQHGADGRQQLEC